MTSPRKIFYWAAMLLGIAAVILNAAWHQQEDQLSAYMGSRMTAAVKQHIPYVRDAETIHMANVISVTYHAGATCMVLAFVSILVAFFRREQGRYVIPCVIIALAFMIFIIL